MNTWLNRVLVLNEANTSSRLIQGELQELYKKMRQTSLFSRDHVRAYCVTRLPPIYEVVKRCLREIERIDPTYQPKSVLDLGCGPLTSLWALLDVFENFAYQGIESHPLMIEQAEWMQRSLGLNYPIQRSSALSLRDFGVHDLVIASHLVGELKERDIAPFIDAFYGATNRFGLITLAGTPQDFSILLKLRELLRERGAFLLAPCAALTCPFEKGERWCHFTVHVSRTPSHQFLKKGELNFEYEKFSYLLFSKSAMDVKEYERLLSMPKHHKGHVIIETCSKEGYKKHIINKKQKDRYQILKKAILGDIL